MKDSFSLKFYLSAQKAIGVPPTVYLRIIVDRQKAELSTRLSTTIENWDEISQRLKKGKAENAKLDALASDIRRIRDKLDYLDKPISAKIIRDIYTGAAKTQRQLLEYFTEHMERLDQLPAQEIAKGTVANYRATLNHLQKFMALQKIKDIGLEQVNYKLLSDFDAYLLSAINSQTGKYLERNTANKQHQRLKAVLNKAIREEILTKNPYANFTFKFTKSHRDFLTDEELDDLTNHTLGGNKSLLKVKDIYLFSVYTGLRFSDAMGLKMSNVIREKDGNLWIEIVQEKTNEPIRNPLLDPATLIIEKYKEDDVRKIHGYVLPRISNQKLNSYLKVIANLVGIDKELTHHTARHTFATTVTLSNDVPFEIVGRMLGHTSLKSTQIYAKITNQYLKKVTSVLNKKLEKLN